jgi:hypothetical protein
MLSSHFGQLETRKVWSVLLKLVRLVSLVGVIATNSASGIEQHSSSVGGWTISAARPSDSQVPLDLQQQMILDTIFRSHAPLLTSPPASPAQPSASASDKVRVATRPEGVGGWRPARSAIATAAPRDISPLPVAPQNDAALPDETGGAPAPGQEDIANEQPESRDLSPKPLTVQFRAPRLAKTQPEPSDAVADHSQKTSDISKDFEDIDCFARLSELDSSIPKTSGSRIASIPATGPTILPPADRRIAGPADEAPGPPLPAGQTSGDGHQSEAADSLVPVDAIPNENETEDSTNTGVRQDEPEQTTLPAARPLPPLTRQLVGLRSRVRSVLNGYFRKTLNSRDHDPWEVMHGMLAYGVKSRVRQGGPRGDLITSVGWLCYNKPCKGQTMMHVTRDGELRAKYGVGLQGHLGQLLAMLAQCHVSEEYPIRVGRGEFTIRDLIESEKKTCYPKSELTFKLLAFQYYLDLNEKWVNDQGLEWDFPRLIREELAQPMRGAACGGTHRLSALSLTVKARLRRGEPLDGEYARAAEFVEKHHKYAFRLQNRDGSLSTSWFNGRGDESDIDRRIKTTGHILEWLCYSLSDEELRDQRTIRAVTYLANLMYSNYNNEWEVGPMCHATHALLLYDERVFQPYDQPGYAAPYRPKPATAVRAPQGTRR